MEGIGYLRHCFRRARGGIRLVSGAFACVLLFCAIGGSPGSDPVRDAQIGTLLFVAGFTAYGILKRALTAPIAALISYGLICWTIHGQSVHGLEQFGCVAGALVVALWLGQREALPLVLSWAGALEGAFGLAQFMGWNPWHYANAWELYKPTGTFGQETILGAFLAACLAPALFTKQYFPAFFIAIGIISTHSSMSAASGGAVLFLWIVSRIGWRHGALLATSLSGFFVVLAWAHQDSVWLDPNGRIRFWSWAWNRWLERPIFGFGPGSWLESAPGFELRLTHAHNEFLEFLTEYGSVGALFAGWSLVQFTRKFKPTWERAMCIGLLVDAFGNFPFHIASLGTIFLTGWLLSVREKPLVLSLYGQGGQH